jgi:hypothetical protein
MRFSVKEFREKLKTWRFRRVLSRQIEDILGRVDALPTLDPRSPDEILGYDKHGLPH